jgi:hypothetical protein
MGTHIDCFFPRTVDRSIDVLLARLLAVFGQLSNDLALIRERGRFSREKGEWRLVADGAKITGEGPSGFSISVYSRVIKFTSVERFSALEYPDLGIQESLHRVFEAVAFSLGRNGELAVAAGGFGDTDKAHEIAAQGRSFEEVCQTLEVEIGAPARNWEELESELGQWYLASPAESGTADVAIKV